MQTSIILIDAVEIEEANMINLATDLATAIAVRVKPIESIGNNKLRIEIEQSPTYMQSDRSLGFPLMVTVRTDILSHLCKPNINGDLIVHRSSNGLLKVDYDLSDLRNHTTGKLAGKVQNVASRISKIVFDILTKTNNKEKKNHGQK